MIYISHLISDNEIRQLSDMGEFGLESIEFSIAENLDDLKNKVNAFRSRLCDMNITEHTMHGPYLDLNPSSYDSAVLKVTRKRFEQAYEAAAELGAKKLIFHSGFLYRVHYLQAWPERTADFFNSYMEGKQGITVCLENVYDPEPEALLKVAKSVESEDFALCLDIGHAHCNSKVPLEKWIELLSLHTAHIHVHDNNKAWDYHMTLGRGTIPTEKILPLLRKKIPDAAAVIECAAVEDVRESYKILKEYGF